MGLSASQARFLQLTGRKSDVEYQAQQVCQARLMLSQELTKVSSAYNDKVSNKKLVFTYADSTVHQVDITYSNYKNYINQQLPGLQSSQQKMYLVSTSGKLVVQNENEMLKMIEDSKTYIKVSDVEDAKNATKPTPAQKKLAEYDWSNCEIINKKDDEGNEFEYYLKEQKFTPSDFVIVEDLDNVDVFKAAIQDGTYLFATLEKDEVSKQEKLIQHDWATAGNGAITDKLDEGDDAAAESEYKRISSKLENEDKKLQMTLERLETERNALDKEMDAVQKVIKDNVDSSFKTFNG